MQKARLLFFFLAACCQFVKAQGCPPPEQPALSKALTEMITAERADDAMQCIISISTETRESGGDVPDDVRYQLAKQASDAIESLGGEGSVMDGYNSQATGLWQDYLENVKEPFDRGRLSFAITKIMQHGRFGAFQDIFPALISGIVKAKNWVSMAQSDQLFSIIKRCPLWSNTAYSGAITCNSPCPSHGNSLLAQLSGKLDQDGWIASPGLKRLSQNAKALKEALACHKP